MFKHRLRLFIISCIVFVGVSARGTAQNTIRPVQNLKEEFFNFIDLKSFQAVIDGLSVCHEDQMCLQQARIIKGLSCVDAVCSGQDTSKKPLDCLSIDEIPKDQQTQVNAAICDLIKTPNTITRQAVLKFFPDLKEDYFVVQTAYNLALKKSAHDCESYIMDYVGLYGPQWTPAWHGAMAGCRILGRKTTAEKEEKDIEIWFDTARGEASCSEISIREMRNACVAATDSILPPRKVYPVEPNRSNAI